eukprot:gene23046-30240_t
MHEALARSLCRERGPEAPMTMPEALALVPQAGPYDRGLARVPVPGPRPPIWSDGAHGDQSQSPDSPNICPVPYPYARFTYVKSAETMTTTATLNALAYSKTASHPEETMHVFFTSNESPYHNFRYVPISPLFSQFPAPMSAETIATTASFVALAYSKTAGHPEETMHVFFTSNGSPYQNF